MNFYLFQSSTPKSQWAATDDRTGQKLPVSNQWTYGKTVTENRIGFDATEAAADIRKQGFHLFRVEVKFKVA